MNEDRCKFFEFGVFGKRSHFMEVDSQITAWQIHLHSWVFEYSINCDSFILLHKNPLNKVFELLTDTLELRN
jgi:hypothetical protein